MSSRIHDYAAKLRHPELLAGVKEAVQAQNELPSRSSLAAALRCHEPGVPGPISINLDLTVACNYACAHCIDAPILNTGRLISISDICRSLVVLRLAGLRSVILIGGGEPTLHPRFRDAVRMIKLLGLQCAIVSNGSQIHRLQEVAPFLEAGDWIRLSLDAGLDETFRIMHQPRKNGLTLKEICRGAGDIKRINPKVALGFSYIVTWEGSRVLENSIAENLGEMAAAAVLAKESGFDFIAFKPLLDRDELGGETISFSEKDRSISRREKARERLAGEFARAKTLEDGHFKVHASVNLRALTEPVQMARLQAQPRRCHMRLFRQVLTPLGVFGCPVYRGNDKDRIGSHSAYTSVESFFLSRKRTRQLVEEFDASRECQHVSCIYNSTNRWLQAVRDGIEHPESESATSDFFL